MEDGRWHAVAIRGFGILDLPLVSHVTVVESLSHSALSVFICEMDDNEDDNGLLGNMSNKWEHKCQVPAQTQYESC